MTGEHRKAWLSSRRYICEVDLREILLSKRNLVFYRPSIFFDEFGSVHLVLEVESAHVKSSL